MQSQMCTFAGCFGYCFNLATCFFPKHNHPKWLSWTVSMITTTLEVACLSVSTFVGFIVSLLNFSVQLVECSRATHSPFTLALQLPRKHSNLETLYRFIGWPFRGSSAILVLFVHGNACIVSSSLNFLHNLYELSCS